MKHKFSILLVMCILMVIGVGLAPLLDISNEPQPELGKTLTIYYGWHNASAKVIEQNVTSRIESTVSMVKGVEKVSSVSMFGFGSITIEMKPHADVSMAKFEISAMLRQMYSSLPKGLSYPIVDGGNINTSQNDKKMKRILTYQINADRSEEEIRKLAEKETKRFLERIEGIDHIEISGVPSQYMEISYDANDLALYGLNNYDIIEAVRSYAGREDLVGEVSTNNGRSVIPLVISSKGNGKSFEEMPLKTVAGKTVYLNDLTTCNIRRNNPDNYYRVNGMNSVYVNIFVEKDASAVRVSNTVKDILENKSSFLSTHSSLIYDKAEIQLKEFRTLLLRSSLTIVILLLFVWFISGMKWAYTCIISIGLLANILISVVAYWFFDVRLHPMSIAGITISLGIIIDSTIVMVDHYSYYRNHKAFIGILAAMLTTIGALVIVFWLPDFLRHELKDFSVVVIINLAVSIVVASFFIPALVDQFGFTSNKNSLKMSIRTRLVILFSHAYQRYVRMCQHRFVRCGLLLVFTIIFGGSLYFFVRSLDSNTYTPKKERLKLNIRAKMPVGGNVQELNEKVKEVEVFLSHYKEINRYVTSVTPESASIIVEFKEKWEKTAFPLNLERKVIAKVITIGGADWSISGISENGFSNSISLQLRSTIIRISGYDYARLYRFAEDMFRDLQRDKYVEDLAILTTGYEQQDKEYYMIYNHEVIAVHQMNLYNLYSGMHSLLSEGNAGEVDFSDVNIAGDHLKGVHKKLQVVVRPINQETYDIWQIRNSYLNHGGRNINPSYYLSINERYAKSIIPRENQEYTLDVAFNVLNSWSYTDNLVKTIIEKYNTLFPEGFRCVDSTFGSYEDDGTQYWLIGIIAIVIFFIISILFESLMQALAIVSLIPISFIGLFLTYSITGVPFGIGGFAAMVLLSGLTVNAGIYILCQNNDQCTQMKFPSHQSREERLTICCFSYVKAFNHKIIPILLTILSTILGMIPFLIDGSDEQPFWYSLAVGTIGGLAFSVVPLFLFLPSVIKFKPT